MEGALRVGPAVQQDEHAEEGQAKDENAPVGAIVRALVPFFLVQVLVLGLVAASGVALASLAPLWKRNLRRTPLYIYGMVIAHLGIAVSMAGMASESAFNKETLVASPLLMGGSTTAIAFLPGYALAGWIAPLLGAALVGGAIYSTLPPAPVVIQQPPVMVPQPQVITDPSRVSYYCAPYQQYYPNVTQCPTAWQVVPY